MSEADSETQATVGRRTLLKSGAAAAGAAVAAGATGTVAAQETEVPVFPDYLSDANGYNESGVEDLRGESSVTIEVGAGSNGFAFAPATVWIDPGTTVQFEWTGQGGAHNVVSNSGPASLDSGDTVSESGVNYEFTFEEGGINTYYCNPHQAAGMKGGIAVGDDVETTTVESQDSGNGGGGPPEIPDYVSGANGNPGEITDERGSSEVTVQVGSEDGFAFTPTVLWVDPGTTVQFEWTGNGGAHNVVSNSGPADLDSGQTVAEAGVNFEHTFEQEGVNTYYCNPHQAAGMKGAVLVGAASGGGGGGESGGHGGGGFGGTLPMILGPLAIAIISPILFAVFLFRKLAQEDEEAASGGLPSSRR
jgi:halocyanin-like protein